MSVRHTFSIMAPYLLNDKVFGQPSSRILRPDCVAHSAHLGTSMAGEGREREAVEPPGCCYILFIVHHYDVHRMANVLHSLRFALRSQRNHERPDLQHVQHCSFLWWPCGHVAGHVDSFLRPWPRTWLRWNGHALDLCTCWSRTIFGRIAKPEREVDMFGQSYIVKYTHADIMIVS